MMDHRSRLYSLAPMGLGTAQIESLLSYVVRLAEAHCVTPYHLMVHLRLESREIIPLRNTFWWVYAPLVNGPTNCASWWVHRLGSLTRQNDMKMLTMLPWRSVLTHRDLLRPSRAWCPACFSLWREQDVPLYEPLLWAFKAVNVCPLHHIALSHRCPHQSCHQPAPLISPLSRPGRCGICQGWLGNDVAARSGRILPSAAQADPRQLWTAKAIGEMLMVAPSMAESPSQDVLGKTTGCYAHVVAQDNLAHLARLTAVPAATLRHWCKTRRKARLDTILKFCHALNTTPLRVLTGVDYAFHAS